MIPLAIILILLRARLIGKAVNSRTPDCGITQIMYLAVTGTKQWINIFGQDIDNPVLRNGMLIKERLYTFHVRCENR